MLAALLRRALERRIVAHDARPMRKRGTITVTQSGAMEPQRKGFESFYRAKEEKKLDLAFLGA